jgi:hypothetical protein
MVLSVTVLRADWLVKNLRPDAEKFNTSLGWVANECSYPESQKVDEEDDGAD